MNDIPAPGSVSFPALGTTATLLVADPRRLETATAVLNDELAAIDAACSRFRPDSELSRVNHAGGARLTVSALFAEALETALHGAEISGGAVDPTVGAAVMALGYDRTFTALPPATTGPVRPLPAPARGHGVEWDGASRSIRLPPGCLLDFGATAKALAADRAARHASAAANCGVLVNLGGDLSMWGEPSPGGWRVAILDDHAAPVPDTAPTVRITGGGLATSGITARTWRRAGRQVHHIVDPVTGDNPALFWRTVTVAAATCVDANIAATEALVRGERALGRLIRGGSRPGSSGSTAP